MPKNAGIFILEIERAGKPDGEFSEWESQLPVKPSFYPPPVPPAGIAIAKRAETIPVGNEWLALDFREIQQYRACRSRQNCRTTGRVFTSSRNFTNLSLPS